MKKKGIKVAKKLIDVLMVVLILISLVTIALSVYNLISYNVEVAKYVYLAFGVFLLPFELLTAQKVDGIFQQQTSCSICLIVAICVMLLSIVVLIYSAKMFNSKYSSKMRNISGFIVCFILFVFFVWFAIGAVLLSIKYSTVENAFNDIGPEFVKTIKTSFGFNLISLKETVVAHLGWFITLFALIFLIIGLSHKSTKVKIVPSLYFYSSDYEIKEENKQKKEEPQKTEQAQSADIPESNPRAKGLIKKIMQLEQLKKAGKISNVDYTRLREKAIKRYKN